MEYIRKHKALKELCNAAKIHDELVVDVVKGEEKIVEKILRDCMENVVDLRVKLIVNIGSGKNLSETK